ncbi:MAG: hypothetical protein FWG36_06470 [Oscillospiraceae bacterium]|nr:hypothetical protein [Oscillospiraceae bacterium]
MTLDRLKTLVFGRLDELTRHGADIGRDTAHIRDFCARIPGFADTQLRVIGTVIPRRKKHTILHNPPIDREILDGGIMPMYTDTVVYEMPDDFQSVIGVTRADGYNALPFIAWPGDRELEIAYLATGEYVVDYLAFYDSIGDDITDDTVLDVPPEAEPALIAGVAAMCVQHENEVLYAQLFRESQGLLSNLKPKARPMQERALNRLF